MFVEKSILIKIPLHLNWELMYAYGKWPTGCYFISFQIQIEDAYKNRQISYFIKFSLHYQIFRSIIYILRYSIFVWIHHYSNWFIKTIKFHFISFLYQPVKLLSNTNSKFPLTLSWQIMHQGKKTFFHSKLNVRKSFWKHVVPHTSLELTLHQVFITRHTYHVLPFKTSPSKTHSTDCGKSGIRAT